jgi:hypothetical protein
VTRIPVAGTIRGSSFPQLRCEYGIGAQVPGSRLSESDSCRALRGSGYGILGNDVALFTLCRVVASYCSHPRRRRPVSGDRGWSRRLKRQGSGVQSLWFSHIVRQTREIGRLWKWFGCGELGAKRLDVGKRRAFGCQLPTSRAVSEYA